MSDQYRPFGRKARQLAFIDHDWCIGCGYCFQVCPTGALSADVKKALAEPFIKRGM